MFAKFNFTNLVFLIFLSFQTFYQKALGDSYISSTDVIKEIEKTLLFDKESRQKINFYKKDQSVKETKSDYVLQAGDNQNDEFGRSESKGIKIVVVDSKLENLDLREKEKLAYNAVLISQYEVAVELYKQIIAREPNNNYSKFALAVVYQRMGQLSQAKKLYRNLLQNNPSNREEIVGNLLAIIIEESPRDALYLLSRLTTQSPKSSYILAQASIVYDRLKDYENASLLLERAISLDPNNVAYKYNLAIIYDKLERTNRALELYSEVVRQYDDESQVVSIEQVRQRIKTIQDNL